ncbi:hypothetical protein M5K25_016643 [Dendrobium thyrsiflorum]|uniref:Uncharacterized protein n=1 Tax=Dendrobium thyrsiflorum TaxID=117978 RepID=A0ABD0UKA2_DENTH
MTTEFPQLRTITQNTPDIKITIDAIAAVNSPLDPKDIILYPLNDFLSQYQAAKTFIRTNLQLISQYGFYSLLRHEEINPNIEAAQDLHTLQNIVPHATLIVARPMVELATLTLLQTDVANLATHAKAG